MNPELGEGLPGFVSVVHAVPAATAPPLMAGEDSLVHPRAVASRRRDVQWGRAAAHTALAELGADRGPLLRGDHGEPMWPEGIVGAITHSAGHVVVAVARRDRCGGIGVDLEHIDRYFPELTDTVAVDTERVWLDALPLEERARATLELFSAKESIYKAFFPRVGRFFGFSAAAFDRRDGGLQGRLVEPLDPSYPPDRTFEVRCEWHDDLVFTWVVLPA